LILFFLSLVNFPLYSASRLAHTLNKLASAQRSLLARELFFGPIASIGWVQAFGNGRLAQSKPCVVLGSSFFSDTEVVSNLSLKEFEGLARAGFERCALRSNIQTNKVRHFFNAKWHGWLQGLQQRPLRISSPMRLFSTCRQTTASEMAVHSFDFCSAT